PRSRAVPAERGMTTGPDGPDNPDDGEELLLDDVEPEPEEAAPASPPAPPTASPPAPPIPSAALASPEPAPPALPEEPPFEEAAAEDERADRLLFENEAGSEPDADRRAALLIEVARLAEAAGDVEAALGAARAAFVTAPSFVAALGPLRRLL